MNGAKNDLFRTNAMSDYLEYVNELLFVDSSFVIDEDIDRNITISPSPKREDHVYLSVGHKVRIYVVPYLQASRFLIHYQGRSIYPVR